MSAHLGKLTWAEARERVWAIVSREVAAGSWPEWTRAGMQREVAGRLARLRDGGFILEERVVAGRATQLELGGTR